MDLDKRSKDFLIANYSKQIKLSSEKLFNYQRVQWSGSSQISGLCSAQQHYSFTEITEITRANSHQQGIRKGTICKTFSHTQEAPSRDRDFSNFAKRSWWKELFNSTGLEAGRSSGILSIVLRNLIFWPGPY